MFYQKPQCLKIGQSPFSKCSSLYNKSTKCVLESFELKRSDPFNSARFTSPCLQRCGFIVSLNSGGVWFFSVKLNLPLIFFQPALVTNGSLFPLQVRVWELALRRPGGLQGRHRWAQLHSNPAPQGHHRGNGGQPGLWTTSGHCHGLYL